MHKLFLYTLTSILTEVFGPILTVAIVPIRKAASVPILTAASALSGAAVAILQDGGRRNTFSTLRLRHIPILTEAGPAPEGPQPRARLARTPLGSTRYPSARSRGHGGPP